MTNKKTPCLYWDKYFYWVVTAVFTMKNYPQNKEKVPQMAVAL